MMWEFARMDPKYKDSAWWGRGIIPSPCGRWALAQYKMMEPRMSLVLSQFVLFSDPARYQVLLDSEGSEIYCEDWVESPKWIDQGLLGMRIFLGIQRTENYWFLVLDAKKECFCYLPLDQGEFNVAYADGSLTASPLDLRKKKRKASSLCLKEAEWKPFTEFKPQALAWAASIWRRRHFKGSVQLPKPLRPK